jgi:hypothetical protein
MAFKKKEVDAAAVSGSERRRAFHRGVPRSNISAPSIPMVGVLVSLLVNDVALEA